MRDKQIKKKQIFEHTKLRNFFGQAKFGTELVKRRLSYETTTKTKCDPI